MPWQQKLAAVTWQHGNYSNTEAVSNWFAFYFKNYIHFPDLFKIMRRYLVQRNSHYKKQLLNTGIPVPSTHKYNTILHDYYKPVQVTTNLTENITSLTSEHHPKTKPRLNFTSVYLAIYTVLLHLHSQQQLFSTSSESVFRPLLQLNIPIEGRRGKRVGRRGRKGEKKPPHSSRTGKVHWGPKPKIFHYLCNINRKQWKTIARMQELREKGITGGREKTEGTI